VPPTQYGSADLQSALVVHVEPGLGTHTSFVHVEPAGHDALPPVLQPGKHRPPAHTSPEAHWFENLHTAVLGSHEPATHRSPFEQSEVCVHGQGPFVPPQVTHASW
jgi:hypothetical protein